MSRDRRILHCDMNSFYASVELLSRPALKDKPVAVAGDPGSRHGIILAKNEAAKRFGIVTAETVQSARRKCPDLITLPPHHEKYREYSRILNSIYLEYTDLVEPFSVDESWLDVTASEMIMGDAKLIADSIRERVKRELGLTLSAGVSFNKIFAKMGSDYKKPDATTVISRQNFKRLLWPMSVSEMFMVGRATAAKLDGLGIRTVGDLAHADRLLLANIFGVHGDNLYRYANGLDDEPVRAYDRREDIKSVGHGMTFRRNLQGPDDIGIALTELTDMVSARLRRHSKWARGVRVEVTTPEFKRLSRQKRLPKPVSSPAAFRRAALDLIKELRYIDRPIRLLTVTAIDLTDSPDAGQLTIFTIGASTEENHQNEKDESIAKALDQIRDKFGQSSIKFAHVLGNDIGVDGEISIKERVKTETSESSDNLEESNEESYNE
ncbi:MULTISPECIES: DNA polymerase IV [Mogibacterium]|uniref:DNA polymerase IV n=1 Tax=Mogibacterium timidum ATCC 33093 TaxID=1401079 RepID=X8IS25_9FIRM|nr:MULTISPECIES: DNA polymerase IV [Mogibacterium]EJU20191.1 putative DNA polymerase IV [Mogibacterium sp. CM50]EUC52575.1 putative DNA polymerase IV [Mogibacterium timidum ATCC 33093]